MDYIPLTKVAEKLDVHVKTVHRWMRRAENPLRAVRLGGVLCTTESWLSEFAEPVETEVVRPRSRSAAAFLAKWSRSPKSA